MIAPAPILTPYVDADPAPRIEVFFQEFLPGTATVSVYRSAHGREALVRGAVQAATAGALTRVDFEAPFNSPVAYRAEMFDADGVSLGSTAVGSLGDMISGLAPSASLAPADDLAPSEFVAGVGLISADTWLHNPLFPQGAVKVQLYPTSGASINRPVPGVISRPKGRRVGVVLSEPRQGVTDLQFDVVTTDLETADKVQALLGDAERDLTPVICIRLGKDESRLRVPQPLFLGVLNIEEVGVDVRWGGENTIQNMKGDEVDPPVPGLFVPLLTAADINVSFASAASVNAGHARAIDVNRRYDLAGAASE